MFRSAKPIQIVRPVDHEFHSDSETFKNILESDNIKDGQIVIVSIAGDLRKGKSFMLNFFLRYLNAQYKKRDVTDWIGEKEANCALKGFEWRGGQSPETVGIWMWSEIFTHDYEDAKKVAIILLDTQGIFDNRSTMKENTMTFSISMMVSSVLCFNVMHRVQENDLQNLHLFVEYGELAMRECDGQFRGKPFQTLIFLVRDWPYSDEDKYGKAERYIKKLLSTKEKQAPEIRKLRERIDASMEEVKAFLLPHPGFDVSQTKSFDGKISQIHSDFIKYVKEFVPSILAPENLVVKKINGQPIRAKNLIKYLELYVDIFQGEKLPEPQTILEATAKARCQILCTECLDIYTASMNESLEQKQSQSTPFFEDMDLEKTHAKAKDKSLTNFDCTRKLGGSSTMIFRTQHEESIEQNYTYFVGRNENNRAFHQTKLNEKWIGMGH